MFRLRLAHHATAAIFALAASRADAQVIAPAKPLIASTYQENTIPPALEARFPKLEEIRPKPYDLPEEPPHEGALIDIPYLVDAPDILNIEVLETLPGRPITGEYLVRADGTVSLGYFGNLHVRGLTLEQIKFKVILHMRKYLHDAALGLMEPAVDIDHADFLLMSPPIAAPAGPVEGRPKANEPAAAKPPGAAAALVVPSRRRASRLAPARLGANRPAPHARVAADDKPAAEAARPMRLIPLAENDRCSVEVKLYNSKVYYVDGDVQLAGRFPFQGNETVLDAIFHAGGLGTTADRQAIRLVRPARGGKPARVFDIALDKILKEGDAKSNLQILPGDRLVVGRDRVVEASVQLDRLAAPLNSLMNSWMTYAFAIRQVNSMGIPIGVTDSKAAADPSLDRVRAEYREMLRRLADPGSGAVTPRQLGDALGRPGKAVDEDRPKP